MLAPKEVKKRLRAARAYAEITQEQLGEYLEVSVETIKRSEAGSRTPKCPELAAIAEACGLPRAFFAVSFERLSLADGMDISAIELELAGGSLEAGDAERTAAHLSRAAAALQAASEAFRTEGEGRPPADEDGQTTDTEAEEAEGESPGDADEAGDESG